MNFKGPFQAELFYDSFCQQLPAVAKTVSDFIVVQDWNLFSFPSPITSHGKDSCTGFGAQSRTNPKVEGEVLPEILSCAKATGIIPTRISVCL